MFNQMKRWGIGVVLFLLCDFIPVQAVSITIANVPSEVAISNPFTFTAIASGLAVNSTYYTKVRIGQTLGDLNKGQTNNPLNNSPQDWLSDTDTWSTFPQITSDGSGSWNGSVIGRPGNTTVVGTNLVVLRIRKTDGSTNYDSGTFSFNVNLASSPAPSPSSSPTPASTPIQTPTVTPSSIPNDYSSLFISEYLSYPNSGNEWVEIYNLNDFDVNLDGWFIDDIADDGSAPITISGVINAKSYKIFYLSTAFLNNGGDDVRLLNGNKIEKDKTAFESSIKEKSWSKDNNGNWCQIDPTPNSSNSSCPLPTPTPSATPLGASPTPTPKPSPTPTPTPTSAPKPTPTPTSIPTPITLLITPNPSPIIPQVLGKTTESKSLWEIISIIFGSMLLGLSVIWYIIKIWRGEGVHQNLN